MSEDKKVAPELVGQVVSAAMDKTIVVCVQRRITHRLYGKSMKRTSKYMAHDPEGLAGEGDKVKIRLVPPMSKRKCWVLAEVLSSKIS